MTKPRSLQQEIAQSSPFRNLAQESTLGIVRTATLIRRAVGRAVKGSGLTPAQYNVLRILRGAGAEGHLIGEIGERLVVQDPDIPRLIDRIEKQGWVLRTRQVDDRRCVRVTITRAGRKLTDALDKPVQALHVAQWAHLSRSELRTVLEALEIVRDRALPRPEGD